MVLKSYLAALERTQIVFWVTVASAVANAILNYIYIFGNWFRSRLMLSGRRSLLTQILLLITPIPDDCVRLLPTAIK